MKFEYYLHGGFEEEDFLRFLENPRWPPSHVTYISQIMQNYSHCYGAYSLNVLLYSRLDEQSKLKS